MPSLRPDHRCASAARRPGFTLVELMTAVAIIGVLMSLLLAAVQATRETARKMSCANNLRNQLVALQDYHAAHQRFPAGRNQYKSVEYGWGFYLLPHLEQPGLYAQFNRAKPWDDTVNVALAATPLKIFRCPSTILKTPGKSDYAGVIGSFEGNISGIGIENGVMVSTTPLRPNSIRLNDVIDGASNTLIVAESADRMVDSSSRWVSGSNCVIHDDHLGGKAQGILFSFHTSGTHVGFADGRVQFMPEATSDQIISAICTRASGEIVASF
jgi:prepilin-type N-terminal cleavage/methylation domain-containing protein